MKLVLLAFFANIFAFSHGKLNSRNLKKSTLEVCPAIKCADPCMEYSSFLSQAQPKCSDNEVCVTKPKYFRQGKLRCPACASFVKCKPKSVDPVPCPMPSCLDPCLDYDFTADLTSPKCPESQKCVTKMQYYDPDGLKCPLCLVFDHCE